MPEFSTPPRDDGATATYSPANTPLVPVASPPLDAPTSPLATAQAALERALRTYPAAGLRGRVADPGYWLTHIALDACRAAAAPADRAHAIQRISLFLAEARALERDRAEKGVAPVADQTIIDPLRFEAQAAGIQLALLAQLTLLARDGDLLATPEQITEIARLLKALGRKGDANRAWLATHWQVDGLTKLRRRQAAAALVELYAARPPDPDPAWTALSPTEVQR